MAKFLFTVWPFPGHIHPNVAIGHALSVRGHEVAFYTANSLRPMLEGEGIRCFPFRHVDEGEVEATVRALDALSLKWWKARRAKALLRKWLLDTADAQIDDLAAVVPVWQPDVLVCDPAMWGPLLVTHETSRVPLAIMSYVGACMLPGPDGPILGLPLPRAQGSLAGIGRRLLRSLADLIAADVRKAADQLRARYGLSPIHTSVTAFAGQMPLYLVPSTPAFDRERNDLPDSVHYVGPCTWDKPGSTPSAPWMDDLASARAVVYVTEGTMHSKPPLLLRAALQGLASLPVQVIATTGRHRSQEDLALGPIPSNARLERWISHSDLLPHTDLVVTTGGTGTVLAALAAGVPLVIMPTAWDQPENAWRVVESGAGIRLSPRHCTPEQVRVAVDRILNDESFRRNAERLAREFAHCGGAAQAAELLEDLALHPRDSARLNSTVPIPAGRGGKAHPRATGVNPSPVQTHNLGR